MLSSRWWVLGPFEPSVGISSFEEITELQNSDPGDTIVDIKIFLLNFSISDTRQQTAMGRKPPAKKKKRPE